MIKANCLDPVRANKITEEVRDSLFAKLDLYVKVLVSIGVKSSTINKFADVSSDVLYNIDEISLDTTKRTRQKILAEKSKVSQCPIFRRTFEGDGKMVRHASIMICSRADGKQETLIVYSFLFVHDV